MKRPCVEPGCPALTDRTRCSEHQRQHRQRYGRQHQADRAAWVPRVSTGTVRCWRCDHRIRSQEAWDLGHRPNRASHPEHITCNRSASRGGLGEGGG